MLFRPEVLCRHVGMVSGWRVIVLGSMDHGSNPACDNVFFIFLITGNTRNLFTWFMAFMYIKMYFYVSSFVFCCLFSVGPKYV